METCPFCGDEMRRGSFRVRGRYMSWATANFEVGDGSGEGSHILFPGFLGRNKRPASCCVTCEAVVIDPRPQEDEER